MPFWLPSAANPEAAWPVDATAAHAAGLRCRPAADTVLDTLEWLRDGGVVAPTDDAMTLGIAADKEDRILRAWTAASGSST